MTPIRYLRWSVAGLLCLASTLNYLDRQTLSVLADTIQSDLGLNSTDYANITSAFLVSYTVMYLVGGRIVDRIGTRRSFLVFASAWSVASMVHGLAGTARQFQAARLALGATQPVNFPAGVRAVAEWFPMRERALAVGIFNAGTALGATVAVPLVSAIALVAGWRWTFAVTGAFGFVWVAAWASMYQLPHEHPRLGEHERALIAEGRIPDADTGAPALGVLLRMKETWGCVAARALTDPVTYFLAFWVPLYLQEERGLTLAELGALGWIPFAALAVGNVAAGAVPRALIARGLTLNTARKGTMLVAAVGIAVSLLMVTRAASPAPALGCLTVAFFAHAAWGNIILPAEVFPARAVGTVSGLGGCLGASTGVVTQQLIGHLATAGSWAPLFLGSAVSYLLVQLLVVLLLPELGRIRTLADAQASAVGT